jgi:hypothetical protein
MGVAFLLVASVAIAIIAAFAMDYHGAGQQRGQAGSVIAGTVMVLLLGGLILFAICWRRSPATRSRSIGIWMGIGFAGLIEGICFLGNMR